MRALRSAFVITFAAACTHSSPPPPEEPTRNPPAPTPSVRANPPPPVPPSSPCPPRETIRAGAACAPEGLGCYLPTDGCQPSGFQCTEGRWREVEVTCNPPPPPRT